MLHSPHDYLVFAQECELEPQLQKKYIMASFQSVLYLRRGPEKPGDADMVWNSWRATNRGGKGKDMGFNL